jgi:hypothetical protein
VASGLACSKANTWAAELRAALQCPDQVWTSHMLQGLPIETEPVVGVARRAFCGLMDGGEDGHAELPVPAYMPAFAPPAHKRALARLRLSKAPIHANVQLSVAYTRRWCTRGCDGITDTEHHLLFERPALAGVRAAFSE